MILRSGMTINGKYYPKGSYVSPWSIYPFFIFHMFIFGMSGFWLAYGETSDGVTPMSFILMHGGIAIVVYLVFYFVIFGKEKVKWMFINAGLGILGIWSQIDWVLYLFGKELSDFPWYRHIMPFLYYILYTFLLYQAVMDLTGSNDHEDRRRKVESGYIGVSFVVYVVLWIM